MSWRAFEAHDDEMAGRVAAIPARVRTHGCRRGFFEAQIFSMFEILRPTQNLRFRVKLTFSLPASLRLSHLDMAPLYREFSI